MKNVIFCYMSGGVSQVDSFDPKPRLARSARPADAGARSSAPSSTTTATSIASPLGVPAARRERHRRSATCSRTSRRCADDLAVVRSMTANVQRARAGATTSCTPASRSSATRAPAPGSATGSAARTRTCPASSCCRAASAAVPHGGVGLFGNGFLPAEHQASIIQRRRAEPVPQHHARASRTRLQRARLDFIRRHRPRVRCARPASRRPGRGRRSQQLRDGLPHAGGRARAVSTSAARPRRPSRLYGLDRPTADTAAYARQCLLARRLVERGVRFVELTLLADSIGGGSGANPWDQHSDLAARPRPAWRSQVDQPIAALLTDLQGARPARRDAGRLGRRVRPHAVLRRAATAATTTRTASPSGWPAAASRAARSTAPPTSSATTPSRSRCTVHDLHATMLHLLGIDHDGPDLPLRRPRLPPDRRVTATCCTTSWRSWLPRHHPLPPSTGTDEAGDADAEQDAGRGLGRFPLRRSL